MEAGADRSLRTFHDPGDLLVVYSLYLMHHHYRPVLLGERIQGLLERFLKLLAPDLPAGVGGFQAGGEVDTLPRFSSKADSLDLDFADREEWRKWLEENHACKGEAHRRIGAEGR